MARLHPPGSKTAVRVSPERAERLLAQGWTSADEPVSDVVCRECGFEAKSAAGLATHARRHEE